MKNKITIIIVASIIGLIALSIIQGFLIKNTYQLKKEAFINHAMEPVLKIDEHFPGMDSISAIWQDYFLDLVVAYQKKEIPQANILKQIRLKTRPLDKEFTKIYQSEITKNNIGYQLKFQKKITRIIILDSLQNDTIFNLKNAAPFHLLGDTFGIKKGFKMGQTTWHSTHKYDDIKEEKPIKKRLVFKVETEQLMNIDDWKQNVFKEMQGLLLSSIFIFLFVFGLLFYSIKNLIFQKKIADLKTDFINNISHEFKTPLATLSLATKVLKTKLITRGSDDLEDTANIIERQQQRLQKLTDEVLTNSLTYHEIQLKKTPVKMADYLNEILDDFVLSTLGKEVCIFKKLEVQNEVIWMDKFYITTALLNILENAIKYNDKDVNIHCKASLHKQLEISIQDNGIGISKKNQQHLFDKFYRVGNTEIHTVKGLGLGLYYAKQIIKAHQGDIQVESALGKGTTFTITLPFK